VVSEYHTFCGLCGQILGLDVASVKTKIIPSVGEYYYVYKWLIDVTGRVRTSETLDKSIFYTGMRNDSFRPVPYLDVLSCSCL
jgi:hypothetical protein